MLVTGPHQCLSSILTELLNEGKESDILMRKEEKARSIDLFDFGAKIKIVVEMVNGKPNIQFKIRFQKGYDIHNESIEHLRALFGSSIAVRRLDGQGSLILSVAVNDAIRKFDSPQECIENLSQIRIHTAGAPILKALSRLTNGVDCDNDNKDDFLYKLGSYGNCGTYHCMSTREKAMVVFVVSFGEEMERSLARLFLQQFEATQNKVPLTPHCEFRRPTHLTTELQSIADSLKGDSNTLPVPVGYLSFTFFPSTVTTEQRREKAVELLVNFLPYLDGQVKNTKSMMLSRMRKKRNDLITTLPVAPSSSSSLSTSSSSGNSTNNRTEYLEEVQEVLLRTLKCMKAPRVSDADGFVPPLRPDVEVGAAGVKETIVEARQRVPTFRSAKATTATPSERCLIESSHNSVRVSFLFKQQIMAQSDPLEASILFQWMRFLQQQAEDYQILRRKPLDGYSMSFLILSKHLQEYSKEDIEDWIVNFCAVMDKECSDIKLRVNAEARYGTTEFFKAF
ncbi:ARP2/3 complex subunit (ARPC4) domain containing protein [Nitzschia inconspicua]|uniref:ARP2/3 complex subunit (ARPC4) domain containing protein n=1 Tax=Nitzschia inconspicua TaxID=303405 RepID=A0A9K3LN14_9STRA|nr:ARP2/3 complex subunit (ARPC4) domain containing protein [Nitzschia inconspicua]